MPNDEAKKIDDDSRDQLDQVRKGKPRKFVMICKGTSIISLVVYKKGNVEKYKKQAKEVGTGQIYFGVIEGRGPDITFKLSTEDGFDKAPVKTPVLKAFLEEEANYKSKPLIEIVASLGPVLDPDDPLVQRFVKLQEAALAAADAHPDSAGDINTLCLEIGKHFDQEQPADAEAKLVALEKLLEGLRPPEPTTKPETPVDPRDLEALAAELKKIQPEVEVLLKNNVGDAGRLKQFQKDVTPESQAADPTAALESCRETFEYLKDEWDEARGDAEERIEALLAGSFTERTGDVEKIKTVFGFAVERAESERFGSALVALKNLGGLLDAAEKTGAPKESDVIEEGIVEARKKFVESRWQTALRNVRIDLGTLRPVIAMQNPEEDADDLVSAIEEAIDDFCGELSDAITTVNKAKDGDVKPIARARKLIETYRKRIASDPLIAHLNDAEADLGTRVNVGAALTAALDEIDAKLAS